MRRVVIVSDFHCGHRAGLTPPDWQYQDNPRDKDLRKFATEQRALWRFYLEQQAELKPVDVLIVNGDAIDGKGVRSGGTEQIVMDRASQVEMAEECIMGWDAESIVMTYGCVTAGHRILTADLRYVPVESLESGDSLIGFDENQHPSTRRRYWHTSTVVSNKPAETEVYRLCLSDGTSIEATPDHPFLMRIGGHSEYRWVTVADLYRIGYHSENKNTLAEGTAGTTTQYMPLRFPRFLPVWEAATDRGAGYLAGFFDGEGSLSQRRKPRRGAIEESALTLTAYQNENPALRSALDELTARGFGWGLYDKDFRSKCKQVRVGGGLPEVLRFLGETRPQRLLGKLDVEKLGAVKRNRWDDTRIISIEPAGRKTIYQLETTTKTYVVEGFLSHNTPYHTGADEDWETVLARDVGAVKIGSHEWVEVEGVIFDCKHKTSSSIIPHGRHTGPAREMLWNALWAELGVEPRADVFIRSHVHYHTYAGDGRRLVMTTPALQGFGSKYGARQCTGIVDVGLIHFDCEKGGYSWKAHLLDLKVMAPQVVRL